MRQLTFMRQAVCPVDLRAEGVELLKPVRAQQIMRPRHQILNVDSAVVLVCFVCDCNHALLLPSWDKKYLTCF